MLDKNKKINPRRTIEYSDAFSKNDSFIMQVDRNKKCKTPINMRTINYNDKVNSNHQPTKLRKFSKDKSFCTLNSYNSNLNVSQFYSSKNVKVFKLKTDTLVDLKDPAIKIVNNETLDSSFLQKPKKNNTNKNSPNKTFTKTRYPDFEYNTLNPEDMPNVYFVD